ncbi:hypothetical protein SAMN05216505_11117 [Streptomyces prasinopilosus]|uniref:Uncharacterized protein n=1 Tax=Streptomyces prasinopilosus TaxID=67344 RepID=A0A1G6X0Y4_9ACTN|nr:hypothetical protein SAMN05216505_11117 [Streptomyces prasinopilosus]
MPGRPSRVRGDPAPARSRPSPLLRAPGGPVPSENRRAPGKGRPRTTSRDAPFPYAPAHRPFHRPAHRPARRWSRKIFGCPQQPPHVPAAASVASPGRSPAVLASIGSRSPRRPAAQEVPSAVPFRHRVTAFLHRFGKFFPSTSWGPRSCPDPVHRAARWGTIRPGQLAVDAWTSDLHSLWTKQSSTGCGQSFPRTTHRLRPVVPSDHPLLHTSVHCSATRSPSSLGRVKGVTSRCRGGLWERPANLGTELGRTRPYLCTECAELSVLHRHPELSTGSAHRASGQNLGPELRKRGYPRYPQPLLLLPTRESEESVSKEALCTTRRISADCPSARLDLEGHLLSVQCVRLVPVSLPSQRPSTPSQMTKAKQGARTPATAGGGLR